MVDRPSGFPDATTAGIDVRFHPNLPAQNHNSVWTFDGTMPPKLLMVRYGQPILMRHYNATPIDSITKSKSTRVNPPRLFTIACRIATTYPLRTYSSSQSPR